ncbi:uncharacterized protein PV09_02551 [Verruconis gallopava]|uniref:Kinesin motor domain-containing protein n=1 Tax=Verruconis gallopava TaxID=253628 RepID=A0A0D2AJY3_9PEZI|nr:uncharacterized protein PV09_02551 [Verruconis gallopava]KIW06875.1 hypothetical protein PV09_02551 [Verruconis gallopava]
MASPPGSPPHSAGGAVQRPMSMMVRPNRSSSRMSVSSKNGIGSKYSDEDGKTAVKVAVRVRPPLQPTDPGFELVPQRFRSSIAHVTSPTSLTVESAQGKKLFVFDRVFPPETDQEGVWEYLSESVNSFVQGYNVSILAYGQSGAGKSFTMGTSGPAEQNNPRIMGVVPRAAAALFEKLCGTSQRSGLRSPNRYSMTNGLSSQARNQDKNWQLKATYVEIYQEQLRDLLLDDTVPFTERPQIAIREDTKGRILLTGLKQVPINSIDDLLGALNFGSTIRQTDATAINARSSRSHAVFSLNLIQKRSGTPTPLKEKRRSVPLEAMSGSSGADSWITVDSKLHFVDLAGSERLKNTGAQGERAKEGISINAGLASLGKVIAQLSSRSAGSHVSYRDSKLTRLLQDSLGGNAITYMVACVNPAEFHLSETLNTVQYAQRARAIQSKPQIQAVSDDSDKQAVIDRLRAEVQFLRDQIRLSEKADRRNNAPQERAERQHERESELQNQYLDLQENYNALSERHSKLIQQISRVQNVETDGANDDIPGETALERQERSRSFQGAIEDMILEYEKTIQSLETSLSNTRGSLSATESALLEKETKIAYLETVQSQLQARLQKSMDREQNDENYLRDLEARVAGATTGEEKSNALVQGLRKELARARENEASCEEYISTLEERLAEAEQDHEMMQREIERLEHVVERQRSINKLDNLLYELDSIRHVDVKASAEPYANGHVKKDSEMTFRSRADSEYSRRSGFEDAAQENGEPEAETLQAIAEHEKPDEQDGLVPTSAASNRELRVDQHDEPTSPAQSKFVADKLETVTQELFDLRMEHEATVNDLDELQRKYQMALKQLAEMHEAREVDLRNRDSISSRPSSFLADTVASTHGEEAGQPSSSRTLSSELSSAMELPAQSEASDETTTKETVDAALAAREEELMREMEELRKLHMDKELSMAELEERHNQLQEQHQDTLDYVEELKAELQKAQLNGRASPSPQFIRRKSSQILSSQGDRANRAFASLRNLALENLEEDTDKLQSFELNLNSIMAELQSRSERVTVLEAETVALRKEMETKMTIINGLTRERTSLKAAQPLDMSAIASMHDKLKESESRQKQMSEAHSAREKELLSQIESLRAIATPVSATGVPGEFPATPADMGSPRQLGDDVGEQQRQLEKLQREVADWRSKHDSAMESMRESEKRFTATISELESSLRHAEQNSRSVSPEMSAAGGAQEETIAKLNKEIQEYKSKAEASAQRLAELEKSYNSIVAQVEEDSHAQELTIKELQTHRELVANLETQLEEHKNAVQSHQLTLEALRSAHAKEIEELTSKASISADEKVAAALAEQKEANAALQQQLDYARAANEEATVTMQAEIEKAKNELKELLQDCSMVLNKPTNASNLTSHILTLVNAKKDIATMHDTATGELKALRAEVEETRARAAQFELKFNEMKAINDETMKELEKVSAKELRNARLVQELEDQLNSNYDQTQAANNRLSALQTERQSELERTVSQLQEAQSKIAALEQQLADMRRQSSRNSNSPAIELERSNSGSNNLRKSVSAASLPSPPPAIPLPPLPGTPVGQAAQQAPSPPQSRHQSKDIAQAQLVEDQEARIRTIEKHLFAEKQLTATLEEALTDLESSSTKMKSEMEGWRRKCATLEEELTMLRKERQSSRLSVQQLEEERNRIKRLEAQRAELEQRMATIQKSKKKKSSINCF